jgi:hypothetical protein
MAHFFHLPIVADFSRKINETTLLKPAVKLVDIAIISLSNNPGSFKAALWLEKTYT